MNFEDQMMQGVSSAEIGRRTMAWRLKNFSEQGRMRHALQIVEEVTEAYEDMTGGVCPNKELADVVLSVCAMAAFEGITLRDEPLIADLNHLIRHTGKLARAVGKESEGIRPESRGDVAEELQMIYSIALCLMMAQDEPIATFTEARLTRMEGLVFSRG